VKIGINFQSKDTCYSGVERYSLGLIGAMAEFAPRHQYVIFTNRSQAVREQVIARDNVVIRQSVYPNSRVFRIAWEHLVLPGLARDEGLDVLHCPNYVCPLRSSVVPCVVTCHDTIALDHPEWCQPSNAFYYKLVLKATANRAACVVAVSRHSAEDVRRRLGIASERVRVVYPGLDSGFNSQLGEKDRSRIRSTYHLPERYLLYVGNIEPRKNLPALLKAYRILRERKLPHKLVLVGQRTWRSSNVLEQVRRTGGSEGIIQLGYVPQPDLPGIYQLADLYVCPSLHEGFGFPPLEAMASGIPVLSSGGGALAETLGDAAYPIDPADPSAIAAGAICLLTDQETRRECIRRGIERSRMFRWELAAQQLQAIYREVVSSPKAG
jgi:glycosyltransferase involved in cell wall biosynthesis